LNVRLSAKRIVKIIRIFDFPMVLAILSMVRFMRNFMGKVTISL